MKNRRSPAARGYILPLVLLFAVILAVGFSIMLTRLAGSTASTEGLVKRKQAFFAADGVARAATEVVSAELTSLPPPPPEVQEDPVRLSNHLAGHTATLEAALRGKKEALTPSGFVINNLSVANLAERRIEQLANGPFRGMVAQVQPFTIDVDLNHADLSRGAVSSVSSTVQRGTISMFQFFAFIDGYAYLYTGTGARFAGRIHANGNVCMGSGGGLYAEQVTSAGGFYLARSSGCRNEARYHESSKAKAYIAKVPLANGLADLSDDDKFEIVGVGCGQGSCSGREFDRDDRGNSPINEDEWRTRSLARWNGQLQDSAHGVPHLAVPVVGKPLVQRGRNAQHLPESNNENTRFLIDPLLAGEPADVRAQKLAFKADLRILNGVWYVRNPDHPEELGMPIWSDHPGHYTTVEEEVWAGSPVDVGQADLFGSGTVPTRYSYYVTSGHSTNLELDYDAPGASPDPLPARPVISYGTLFRDGSGTNPVWVPGFYPLNPCGTSGGGSCSSPFGWNLRRAATRAELLQGTRGGFRDGWGEVSAYQNGDDQRENLGLGDFDPARVQLYNMLPINFDVAAFAEALQDTDTGELGSHFFGREFNGIVWIGSTWPGQLDGMSADAASSSTASFWPFQGTQADEEQPFETSRSERLTPRVSSKPDVSESSTLPRVPDGSERFNEPYQQALPFPLCSDYTGSAKLFADSSSVDGASSSTDDFQAPKCRRYTDDTVDDDERIFARPNAVRVINGRHLDRDVFPKGLTIATNLPAVVLGDFNATSTPSDKPGVFEEDWRPALIAADTVTIQSSNWDDREAPWNVRVGAFSSQRRAGDTTYHFQILAGWLVSHNGNRDEVAYFTRLVEDWKNNNPRRTIRGSVVIGFNAVFGGRFDWNSQNCSDDSPNKTYAYDYNLDLPANQPPGAPRFEVTAVERVRRN